MYGLEGVGAVLSQRLTGAAARFDHLVVLAGRGEHGAAHQTDVWGALAIQQAVDDAQQKVFRPRLHIQTALVAEDVGKNCSGMAAFKRS